MQVQSDAGEGQGRSQCGGRCQRKEKGRKEGVQAFFTTVFIDHITSRTVNHCKIHSGTKLMHSAA